MPRTRHRLQRVHHVRGASGRVCPAGVIPRPVPHPRSAAGRTRRDVRQLGGRATGVLPEPVKDDRPSARFQNPSARRPFTRQSRWTSARTPRHRCCPEHRPRALVLRRHRDRGEGPVDPGTSSRRRGDPEERVAGVGRGVQRPRRGRADSLDHPDATNYRIAAGDTGVSHPPNTPPRNPGNASSVATSVSDAAETNPFPT